MDLQTLYRLRIEMCIHTIIDMRESIQALSRDHMCSKIFSELRDALIRMDLSAVSESDVILVEKATGALLHEFKPLYDNGACTFYHGLVN